MSETFDRQSSFGWLINVVANDAAKTFDTELKKHGLTLALWPTLMCLWEEEGVTQRDIAQKSKVENSTTTRTLDKLENLGLVKRQPDPNSRRAFRIYLTDEGRALKETLVPIPMAINQKLLSSLDPEERDEIIRLLQKMVAAV
ncbi:MULTISPECIES: MarR family winged helix-turn-helix transcriptional regulator [Vibrio]|uniref:MarR family winged helix-turn-helix transcriptional regulator n=1 Tax=Vibrio TaxID=662 RepID=UPI001267E4CB|nr:MULTISPECIES: MarR family transcriptional regulator [unclassified Vibrio]MCM5508081.1 MarR family transcriptional regulator [Vibrio sp. SCSIO 43169]MDE3897631.1 MarR family transcriptional regulator [Vibrio sp. CC007]QFT39293.1 HTH-type transcriptional repressor NicR [Vibrio sp. THAF64]QGM36169.1 HTH-type transcriptional repressor NicR [Vibrio sp. THAF191d]QGN71510.1 HTH-type transcriptional repressor NicR [Vibrio sp. THAF191c]